MKNLKIITLALLISIGSGLTINKVCSQTPTPTIVRAVVPQQQAPIEYVSVNPLVEFCFDFNISSQISVRICNNVKWIN